MQLSYSPTSPYVRKVMVVLHETGQLDDVTLVRPVLNPFDFDPALVAVNPIAKVPALITDEGQIIYDSRVICGYLDARVQAGLYGSGATHWGIRTLEATADGIIDAAFNMAVEVRFRPEQIRSTEWMEGQWTRIMHGVAALDAKWIDHLTGPMDIGHIAVACALDYLDTRHSTRDWRNGHQNLAAWSKNFSKHPSMIATHPSRA